MLTPTQLNNISNDLEEQAQRLGTDCIDAIVKGVSKTLTLDGTSTNTIKTMQGLGYDSTKIRAEVMKDLNSSSTFKAVNATQKKKVEKELNKVVALYNETSKKTATKTVADAVGTINANEKAIYKRAGRILKGDVADQLIRATATMVEQNAGVAVKTLAFRTSTGKVTTLSKVYQKEVDYALTSVASGLKTSDEAVSNAVKNLSHSGLRVVDYASGRSFQLDTAIRNAVQTSFSQLAGNIAQSNVEEMGVEYVEVSRSLAPRPSHAEWEGQIYTVKDFKKKCHFGETDNAEAIYSYNCHHMHYPYFKGISSPMAEIKQYEDKTINDKNYTGYELTQAQRGMERNIRALNREKTSLKNAGLSTTKVDEKLSGKKAAYKKFSQQAGIKESPNRLK